MNNLPIQIFKQSVKWRYYALGVRLVVSLVLATEATLLAEPAKYHIITPDKATQHLPQVPPLALVENRDDSGKTWQVSGTLPGSPVVASREFEACFERQGWRLDKVVPIGRGGHNLYLWRKGRQDILLMLWGQSVAKTGFSFGLNNNQQEKKLKK